MKSNYKQLGQYIRPVDVRNRDLSVSRLLGVSIAKEFMPSIANTVGTDMSSYKIVRTGQFAYGPVTSRNGDKISVALLREDECIISSAYTAFEIIDTNELDPEYLMLWFRRPEFDRYARYHSHGSVREIFGWDEMCRVTLPVPHISLQKDIVKKHKAISMKIAKNSELIVTCEKISESIYNRWFTSYDFSDTSTKFEDFESGKLVWNQELQKEIPEGWSVKPLRELLTIHGGKDHKHLPIGKYKCYGSGGYMRHVNEKLFEGEAVLVPRKGTLSNIMHVNEGFWTVDTMFYCVAKKRSFTKFLYFELKKMNLKEHDVGSAVPSMTSSLIYDFKVAVPAEESLVDALDALLNPIFDYSQVLKEENEVLSSQVNSLIEHFIRK